MSFVDLHCHSRCSDGTLTPHEVVRTAHQAGLSALSLTDHDTIAGCAEAADEARSVGIDFLPGVELSCQFPRPGTMHLLGYGVDPTSPTLTRFLDDLAAARHERNLRLIEKLNALHVPVTYEELQMISGGGMIGRPHFAKLLIRKNVVRTNSEAFNHYLGSGGSAYIDKERFTPRQAIDLVHQSGGLCVLAHPLQLRRENSAQLRHVVRDLADHGLDGIEVIHSDHRDSVTEELSTLADKMKLLKTGGSDFHGSNKPHIKLGRAGRRRIPRAFYDELRARLDAPVTASTSPADL